MHRCNNAASLAAAAVSDSIATQHARSLIGKRGTVRLVCIKMRQVFSPPDNKQSTWSDGGDTEKRKGTRSGSAAPTAATTCGAMDPPMPPYIC